MIYFIKALIRAGVRRKGTFLVFAYLLLLVVSSGLIVLVEPVDSDLTRPGTALWWSVVTTTTVGYGDVYPVSAAGKIIAVFLPMFMGIGLGAAFITHVASWLIEKRDQKMHGEKPYTGSGHILVAGFTDETPYLIDQIRGDETYSDHDIVVLADLSRHPAAESEDVFFVKGPPDTLSGLDRAGVGTARRIIIHTGSDEESLFALINALKRKDDDCRITVRCLSTQSLDTFSSVPGEFDTIMQMTAEMMVQAMQDKVHLPLQLLLKNEADSEEIYYLLVPEVQKGLTWKDLHLFLMDRYRYLSFAIQTAGGQVLVNPPHRTPIEKGTGIWLIAPERPVSLSWPA